MSFLSEKRENELSSFISILSIPRRSHDQFKKLFHFHFIMIVIKSKFHASSDKQVW